MDSPTFNAGHSAAMGVEYYVINDPLHQVMADEVRIYRLRGGSYERQASPRFPELRLGLTLWDGVFEAVRHRWLRWVDEHGALIPTGGERADDERRRAKHVQQLLVEERYRADEERRRAERLEALLRRSGIDPGQE